MTVYYNEFNPFAAAWLRELIVAGHIAPGYVDERSIEDVRPSELAGFTQCHFFAGIGVWSYALRRAGWSDDRQIWTGSCPCQPFSTAGKGAGFDDERHLWPAFYHLIKECKPERVVGEQVAGKDADAWIDLVQADMEAMGYAFGAVPFPSASVGAPHIRDRLYWVANAESQRWNGRQDSTGTRGWAGAEAGGIVYGLDHTNHAGLEGHGRGHQAESGRIAATGPAWQAGEFGGLADAVGGGYISSIARPDQRTMARGNGTMQAEPQSTGPTNGHWRDADWLYCRDGKWRPIEPGTFPLAHGAPARVGRLRGYGNAINAIQAQIFIETIMETT